MEHNLDYSHIEDGIFVGTNQCCQMHFDEKLLKEEGVSADISLEEERIDQPFGVETYLWLPTKDLTAPTLAQLEVGVSALRKLVAAGKKIYVHCKNGHGRGPTLVAAYLTGKGMSPEAALELLKLKRPVIHLSEAQIGAIKSFSENVHP